jgi:hypothetical protein
MTKNDYWSETLANAAEEIGLVLTPEQLNALAKAVEISHDNIGQAFYSPPASDRYAQIERENQSKLDEQERKFEKYRRNAETAIKTALRVHPDDAVGIGEHGEVTKYGGRTERIQ